MALCAVTFIWFEHPCTGLVLSSERRMAKCTPVDPPALWPLCWALPPVMRLPKSGARSDNLEQIVPWWESTLWCDGFGLTEGVVTHTHRRALCIYTDRATVWPEIFKQYTSYNHQWKPQLQNKTWHHFGIAVLAQPFWYRCFGTAILANLFHSQQQHQDFVPTECTRLVMTNLTCFLDGGAFGCGTEYPNDSITPSFSFQCRKLTKSLLKQKQTTMISRLSSH